MDLLEQKSSENLWVSQAKRKVEAPLFPPAVRKISERWHIESQQKVFGLDMIRQEGQKKTNVKHVKKLSKEKTTPNFSRKLTHPT